MIILSGPANQKESGFVYSKEGELKRRTTSSTELYEYDDENRLIQAGDNTFQYDGAGNRLSAIRSGIKTYYVYDEAGNLLAEYDANKQLVRKYIYGNGLLGVEVEGELYSYHFDATGHTTAITNSNQEVVNSYAYTPFGLLTKEEQFEQPFSYAGQHGIMLETGVKATGSDNDTSKVVYYMRRSTVGQILRCGYRAIHSGRSIRIERWYKRLRLCGWKSHNHGGSLRVGWECGSR